MATLTFVGFLTFLSLSKTNNRTCNLWTRRISSFQIAGKSSPTTIVNYQTDKKSPDSLQLFNTKESETRIFNTVLLVQNQIMTTLMFLRRFPLNVRAVSAKIKLPKKYLQHCHILRTDKKNLSLLLLPSWPRERKLDLKLSIFQLKRRFMSVQNKMAPVFSILLRDLKLIFLRMLENFIAGSLGQVN